MKPDFLKTMGSATALTRQGRLGEATAMIQAALGRPMRDGPMPPGTVPPQRGSPMLERMDRATPTYHAIPARRSFVPPRAADGIAEDRSIEGTFAHGALVRRYLLAIPADKARPRSLIVMLHGCSQSVEDFARGTRMSEQGGARGFFVLYPAQSRDANPSGCWNWFREQDQQRGGGEAAFLAQLTRHIVAEYRIDPHRVFIAGLSAGGAMAANVARAYPEVFTAVGIHSGIAAGAATNLPDALAVMRSGRPRARRAATRDRATTLPTIVFHGDQDQTVHPGNSVSIIDHAIGDGFVTEMTESGRSRDGRRFRRTIYAGEAAAPVAEQWTLNGMGHAWSGGDPRGSYTDASGIDASHEMVRFFSEQVGATA